MRKYLVFLFMCLASTSSNAELFTKDGTINRMGSIESRSDGDFVILNGFTSAGSCPLSAGLVVARFHSGETGARSFAVALAAKMAGKEVRLSVDDANKNANGFCYVQSMVISE